MAFVVCRVFLGGGEASAQHVRSLAGYSPRSSHDCNACTGHVRLLTRQFSTTGLSMMAAHCHGAEEAW